MKRIILITLCSFSFILSGSWVQAQSGTEVRGEPVSSPSVNDSANKSGDGNSNAQMVSIITGGLMFTMSYKHFSTCAACNPSCPSECMMGAMFAGLGALSMAQAAENGSAKNSAYNTAGMTDGFGNGYGAYSYDSAYDPAVADTAAFKSTAANLKQLEDKGYFNSKTGTIKGPDGKTYKTSDFASPAAMAAAGIPAEGIASVMDYATKAGLKAEKEAGKISLGALTSANGYADSGGGSGGGGSDSGLYDEDDYGSQFGSTGRGSAGLLNRDPAQVAGMQKNYNGEPIGVAADSIFLMMNRRYKVKEGQDSFLSEMDLRLQK